MTGYAGGSSHVSEGTVVTVVFGLALGASAVLVSAACSSSSTPGQPAAEPSISVPQPLTTSSVVTGSRNTAEISPCVDLTTADVKALGLDPSTKRNADLRGPGVAERGCRWTGKDVLIDVLATDVTVAKYKARTDLVGVRALTIVGLTSLQTQLPNDPGGCRIVSDVPGGAMVIQLGIKFEHEAAVGTDSCTAAIKVMEQVAPILTKQK